MLSISHIRDYRCSRKVKIVVKIAVKVRLVFVARCYLVSLCKRAVLDLVVWFCIPISIHVTCLHCALSGGLAVVDSAKKW